MSKLSWHEPSLWSPLVSRFRYLPGPESVRFAGRAVGLIFWAIEEDEAVFASSEYNGGRLSVIGEELRVYGEWRLDGHGGDSIWELQRSIYLPEAICGLPGYKQSFFSSTAKIVTAGEGYVVLTPEEETWLFLVELRTMQVEPKHSRNRLVGAVYTYDMWSPPVVRTCVVCCKRQGLAVDALTSFAFAIESTLIVLWVLWWHDDRQQSKHRKGLE
ncbi:hypothetical protein ACP70R_049516 [Stipagrostis hirtigluma subsp. patula]